jgi:Protein of unknown function (DUF2457)
MAHHQHDNDRRQIGGLHTFLKLFRLSNAPTVAVDGDEAVIADADEPPDDEISPLRSVFPNKHDTIYKKSSRPQPDRRESLLTRALHDEAQGEEHSPTSTSSNPALRALSTTSTRSNASMASTAELTSDTGPTSPPRSATPSPPLPSTRQTMIPTLNIGKEDPTVTRSDSNEVIVEKTLGRKRCIMFACGKAPENPVDAVVEPKKKVPATEPTKRPCMLRFACPSRENKSITLASEVLEKKSGRPFAQANQPPSHLASRKPSSDSVISAEQEKTTTAVNNAKSDTLSLTVKENNDGEQQSINFFHEFGSSTDEPDAWVNQPAEHQPRLTMSDCMKKELALRQIGKEAEEEAQEEEEEENELEDEDEEANNDNEDDFAPSDGSSDAGNESDDEGGFADSDDESDAESDYDFWAPSKAASTRTAATSNDNLTAGPVGHIRAQSSQQHSIASSLESAHLGSLPHQYPPTQAFKHIPKRRSARMSKMRPSTPELPDSTDFVCGTFDEDRPLEAAYISCREQKKREKHVPVPQDIDPSFPTTDPEDNDDDDAAATEEEDDHLWLKDQLEGFDEEAVRSRKQASTTKKSLPPSPRRYHSPPPKGHAQRPVLNRQNTNRSPPPKHHVRRPSPAPGRLFGRSPTRLGSPPSKRLRSPRGSPQMPLGITITRLAQRPNAGRTASLPHTPNPFFRNYKIKTPRTSNLTFGIQSPDALSEVPDHERHVRGAVDIVIGLEKKRQKRKEKFWRQHCRKAAKEQAERKPAPGRGVERMKELGLECAERTKAYGLGQQAQLVLSL